MNKFKKVVLSGVLATGMFYGVNTTQADASVENIAVVQKGDTLYKIASMHDITVPQLMKLNNITDVHLTVGRVLYIHYKPEVKKEISSISSLHTVKTKETLWSISKKYDTTVEVLKKKNKLKSNDIKVGQILSVR